MIKLIENKLAGIIFGFYTVYWAIQWRFDLERPYSDIGDFWDEINVGYYVNNTIDAAQIDGMEHGAWGWADKQLDENWKLFQESFNGTSS